MLNSVTDTIFIEKLNAIYLIYCFMLKTNDIRNKLSLMTQVYAIHNIYMVIMHYVDRIILCR